MVARLVDRIEGETQPGKTQDEMKTPQKNANKKKQKCDDGDAINSVKDVPTSKISASSLVGDDRTQ